MKEKKEGWKERNKQTNKQTDKQAKKRRIGMFFCCAL